MNKLIFFTVSFFSFFFNFISFPYDSIFLHLEAPFSHLFRLRLRIVALPSCGFYFESGKLLPKTKAETRKCKFNY